MEIILSRYRNLTVLLALILAQLLLLAWQVKGDHDARLIRIWAVTAVTPLAKATDWARGGTGSFLDNYVNLRGAADENKRLKEEVGKLRLQNHFLQTQLQTADRAKALLAFQQVTPSRTLPARVIATGTGMNSRAVYIDRGSVAGVKKGMAVIRPEGIVGKVVAAYPTASLVMLMTEQGFAAGVISQKNRARGTLRGMGAANLHVDYVQNEQKVELGEWFYTTGDDRIFPKGLPVGLAVSVKEGRGGKDIVVQPFAIKGIVEEVLVVLDGVHGEIPEPRAAGSPDVQVLPPPPASTAAAPAATPGAPGAAADQNPPLTTDADRLLDRYRRVSESQGIVVGQTKGRVPDFTKPPPPRMAPVAGTVPADPNAPGAAAPVKPSVEPAKTSVDPAKPSVDYAKPPVGSAKPVEPAKPPAGEAAKPPAVPAAKDPAKPTVSNAEAPPKQ